MIVAPEAARRALTPWSVCVDERRCLRRCDLRADLNRLTSRHHVPFVGWVGR